MKNKIKCPSQCARPTEGRSERSPGRAAFVLPFYSFFHRSSRGFKWKRHCVVTSDGAGETKAREFDSDGKALRRARECAGAAKALTLGGVGEALKRAQECTGVALRRAVRTAAHAIFVNMDFRVSEADYAANLAAWSAAEPQYRRYPE